MVDKTVRDFNESQTDHVVKPVFKRIYPETLNAEDCRVAGGAGA